MRLALIASIALFALPAVAQSPAPAADAPTSASTDAGHPAPTPAMIEARKAARQACAADVAKLCADAAGGGGKVMQCVRQHRSELSSGCTQALMSLRQARKGG